MPDLYATIQKGVRFNRANIPQVASFFQQQNALGCQIYMQRNPIECQIYSQGLKTRPNSPKYFLTIFLSRIKSVTSNKFHDITNILCQNLLCINAVECQIYLRQKALKCQIYSTKFFRVPDLFARIGCQIYTRQQALEYQIYKQKLKVPTLLATKLSSVPDLYATIHKGVCINRPKIPQGASFLTKKCLRVPDLFKRKFLRVPGLFAAKFLRTLDLFTSK